MVGQTIVTVLKEISYEVVSLAFLKNDLETPSGSVPRGWGLGDFEQGQHLYSMCEATPR